MLRELTTPLLSGRPLPERRSRLNQLELPAVLKSLNDKLRVAEQMGRSDESLVHEMRQIAWDADCMIDALSHITRRRNESDCFTKFLLFLNQRLMEYRLEKMMINMKKVIYQWEASRFNFPTIRYSDHSPVERIPTEAAADLEFGVDKGDIQSRLIDLKNKGRSVISIVGGIGAGETTLVRRIFNDSDIVRHFSVRAWVTAPWRFSQKDVLKSIADQVQLAEEFGKNQWNSKGSLRWRLQEFLYTKRYLIVLADVRKDEVQDLLNEIPYNLRGSRILITTRIKELALRASPSTNLFELRLLSDEEGWDVLNSKVRIPEGLKEVGEEIVRRCMGFPPLISIVGTLLSRDLENSGHWSSVLEWLINDQEPLYEHLKETGNNLELYLKHCLYYVALFPRGYSIPARRLIALWVAEGLISEQGNQEPPESIAEKRLTKLVEYNMIGVVKRKADGRVKTCRMHDGLIDFWVANAKEEIFFQVYKQATNCNSSRSPFRIDRLVDHCDGDFISSSPIRGNRRADGSVSWSHYKKLLTFLSFDYREGILAGEEIGNFLRKGIARRCFQGMRVLDLEGVIRPKLPKSIGNLTSLRYLGLRRTYLEMLPISAVENLVNLETLDLKHTYIDELPNLWKLRKLRHLYLHESYLIRFVCRRGGSLLTDLIPSLGNSLKDLRTLWGAFIDDRDSADCLQQLSSLRKLGLSFDLNSEDQMALAGSISTLQNLESLRLISLNQSVQPSTLYFGSLLSSLQELSSLYLFGKIYRDPAAAGETSIKSLPQSLTHLTLSLSELDEDPMNQLGRLQNLKMLRLSGKTYTKNVMTCSSGSFPKLEVLKLWKQEELSELIVREGSCVLLGEFEIRSCKNFIVIPDGFKHLKMLRELKLIDMPQEFAASVNQRQGEDWDKIKRALIITDAERNIEFRSGRIADPVPCPFRATN